MASLKTPFERLKLFTLGQCPQLKNFEPGVLVGTILRVTLALTKIGPGNFSPNNLTDWSTR